MHIDVVDNPADLDGLESAWNALHAADPDAHCFLSWTWMSAWLRRTPSCWLVLVARPEPGAPPVALFPLQIAAEAMPEGGFFNALRMGGYYLAGYTGFLCDPAWQETALPALAGAVRGLNWARFRMIGVNLAPERFALFTAALPKAEFEVQSAPLIDADGVNDSAYPFIRLPDAMETYLSEAMGRATRKNARGALRRIDAGEFRITHADAATLDRDLDILMGFWADKWRDEKGEASTTVEAEDHRAMLRAAFAAGEALVAILWQGETPIGGQGSLIDRRNNAIVCLVGSRDLSIRKPAPGFLLHLHCIRWAIGQGFARYDMLRGGHGYKYELGAEDRVLAVHHIATRSRRNLRGTLEPRSLPAVVAKMKAMVMAGQHTFAAIGCQQILRTDPTNTEALALLDGMRDASPAADPALAMARRHLHEGRLGHAERLLQFAARVYARDGDVIHLLGFVLYRQGRVAEALPQVRRAVTLAPRKPDIHNTLGTCLLALGETSRAVSAFDRALALDPAYGPAQENRARVLGALRPRPPGLLDLRTGQSA